MTKGIIYYTDNKLNDPIKTAVRRQLVDLGIPIVSVSLQPIDFGKNIVLSGTRGYITMVKQIIAALEASTSKFVYFCEHDVLYDDTHFLFTPPRDDIFYYNKNVWRWEFGSNVAIRYDRMLPLSALCVNREFALAHYRLRFAHIQSEGEDKFQSREPALARKWGYEPGTKKKKRGGLTNDDFETWESEYPIIDIRHSGTFSPSKVTLDSFKHAPENWQEIDIDDIIGWHLRLMFDL